MIRKKIFSSFTSVALFILAIFYIVPILIVVSNSFKDKVFISREPFSLPTAETFIGFENYYRAIVDYGLLQSVGWTVFITVGSVFVILFFTSMTGWYIARVKSKLASAFYFICAFSMIIPFQMVMYTLSFTADRLGLNTPWGLIFVYLGFGAGLAVFMFVGFAKSIPMEIEESALVDGCSPIRVFFAIVLPVMKPTYISVAILQAMWVWNDFLLPYLILDINEYKTIGIIIQFMKGSYGRVDIGAIMGALILALIPTIVFYLALQKYIIKGVTAGSVKG